MKLPCWLVLFAFILFPPASSLQPPACSGEITGIKIAIDVRIERDGVAPAPAPAPDPTPDPVPVPIPVFPAVKNGPLPAVLLANSEWYRDITADAVDPNSQAMLSYMHYRKDGSLFGQHWIHPDFGGDSGIPYSVVGLDAEGKPDGKASPLVPIGPIKWADESDKLDGAFAYPIPFSAPVETASDRHCLVYDANRRKLFELFAASKTVAGWKASSASIWDVLHPDGDDQRPLGHTSACAAGIPMTVGLLRYDEVKDGQPANHALMFTTPNVDPQRIAAPARHWVSVDAEQPNLPLLGTRVRLRAGFELAKFTGPVNRGILLTLKKHGAICVDRSGNLGFGLLAAQDDRWINGGGTANDVALLKKGSFGLRNEGFLSNLEVVAPRLVRTKGM